MTLTEDVPKVLYTERLTLRLADPDNEDDCQNLIRIYTDPHSGMGGNARVGVNTPADVRSKHRHHGPRQELCTKAVAPKGMIHLIWLGDELIGLVGVSFRSEMPYPDIGYGIFEAYAGKGYITEAGRAALKFWTETVGVEVMTGFLKGNERSEKTAKALGFVKGGEFDVAFGKEGEEKIVPAIAMVLPGMKYETFLENGQKRMIWATVGTETEKQKNDKLTGTVAEVK